MYFKILESDTEIRNKMMICHKNGKYCRISFWKKYQSSIIYIQI